MKARVFRQLSGTLYSAVVMELFERLAYYGMVLVLEPIVWEDGAAGYRSEEVLLITEDGWEPMTDYPYDPF